MRHIRLAYTALLCLLSAALHASTLTVGAPAPILSLNELLQAPQNTHVSWPSLRGKVVVLEFWATWCGPCVAEIPHLNQLADSFTGRVQFISIDDESDAVVKKFLVSHPMHAWIGIDSTGATFKRFDIASRPTTIVIDVNGEIAKVGVPQDVTPALLSTVLKSGATSGTNIAKPSDVSSVGLPAFTVSFAKSVSDGDSLMASDNGIVQTRDAKATDVLSLVYSAPAPQMILKASLPDQKFDLKVTAPGIKEEALLKISGDIVAASFHIRPHWEEVERSVYVLVSDSIGADKLPISTNTHGGYMMFQSGKLEDVKVSMAGFSAQLGSILGTPVINETNLDGRYDISLSLPPATVDSLSEPLHRLGLHLHEEKRVVHSLVIDPE